MKTWSIVLIILQILPAAEGVREIHDFLVSEHASLLTANRSELIQTINPLVVDLVVAIVGIALHLNKKYLINVVMCGTVVAEFLFWIILNFITALLVH